MVDDTEGIKYSSYICQLQDPARAQESRPVPRDTFQLPDASRARRNPGVSSSLFFWTERDLFAQFPRHIALTKASSSSADVSLPLP